MTELFRGLPACECLIKWLPAYERELLARGVIKHSIDIAQLIGGAAASAGTHSEGGAFDIWQTQRTAVWVARQMGAAAFARTTGSFADNRHMHGVLRGCEHNGPARYQIVALDKGYNGLGSAGMGARDDGPRPVPVRTWQQGLEWHRAQQRKRRIATIVKDLRERRADINIRLARLLAERKAL
jgi:hypothetical protein